MPVENFILHYFGTTVCIQGFIQFRYTLGYMYLNTSQNVIVRKIIEVGQLGQQRNF